MLKKLKIAVNNLLQRNNRFQVDRRSNKMNVRYIYTQIHTYIASNLISVPLVNAGSENNGTECNGKNVSKF